MKDDCIDKTKLLVFSVPFTPFLRIIKDGCSLPEIEFIVFPYPTKVNRLLFLFFHTLGFDSIALFLISPSAYQKIRAYKKRNISVLCWSSYFVSIWMAVGKKLPLARKFIFSWAPMDEDANTNRNRFMRRLRRMKKAKNAGFELYTYNPNDAKKYEMMLTTQVHRRFWNDPLQNAQRQRDFYFIGKSKGRDKILSTLEKKLKEKKFIADFKVFEDKPKEFISFEENVRLSMESRCIVDVVAKNINAGQTLRPLESLFFKKKLLTNDTSIVNCDFYHPDNVFIFDDENIRLDGIEEFMKKPLHEVEESILEKYDVDNWMKRYFLKD